MSLKTLLYSLILLLNLGFAQNLDQVENIFTSPNNYPARAVAYSPDGSLLAVGLTDGTIKILDADSGRQVASLVGHTNWVNSAAFSPDGSFLASGSDDDTVKIWRTADFSLVHSLEEHTDSVFSVAFSPAGDFLTSGSWDNTVKIWRTADFSLVHSLEEHTLPVTSVAFSPAGDFLASGSWDNTVKIWRTADFSLVESLEEHTNTVFSVVFSPAGDFLASGSGDGTVKIWRTADFSLVASLEEHTSAVFSVAFSPAGDFLASGFMDNTVKIWHVNDSYSLHKTIAGVNGIDYSIRSVAFHPAGTSLAVANMKKYPYNGQGVVSLWGTPSRQAVFCPSGCGGIGAPQFAFYNPPQQLSQNQQQLSLQLNLDDGGATTSFSVQANGQQLDILSSKNFSVQAAAGLKTLDIAIPRSLQNQNLNLVLHASNSAGNASQSLYLTYQQQPVAGRKALIIGNSTYPGELALSNPANDILALRDVFENLGFEVTLAENLSNKIEMQQHISDFARKLDPDDITLIYYSGHGMQINNINYLIPTQASTISLAALQFDSISADYVLQEIAYAEVDTTILVLDACRDVPKFRSMTKGTREEGLAYTDNPGGTLIAYAAAPGAKALDYLPHCPDDEWLRAGYPDCQLSPYATKVSQVFSDPALRGESLTNLFQEVQVGVVEATGGLQRPATSNLLGERVYLGR